MTRGEMKKLLKRSSKGGLRMLASIIHNYHKSAEKTLEAHKARALQEKFRDFDYTYIKDTIEIAKFQYKSLKEGFTMNSEMVEYEEISDYLCDIEEDEKRYNHYYRVTSNGYGGYKMRRQPVEGDTVKKGTITVFGLQAEFLKVLDRKGSDLRPVLVKLSKVIIRKLEKVAAIRILTWTCHPEDGCLHFHYSYTYVGKDHLMIRRFTVPGNNRENHLEQAAISCVRLNDHGLWPDEETVNYRKGLESHRNRNGEYPHNYLVSRYLDRFIDLIIDKFIVRRPELRKELKIAEDNYRARITLRAQKHLMVRKLTQRSFDDIDHVRELVSREIEFLDNLKVAVKASKEDRQKAIEQRYAEFMGIIMEMLQSYTYEVVEERKREKSEREKRKKSWEI